MAISLNADFSLQSILTKIGFLPNEKGLYYDFGNFELVAIKGINRYIQKGYTFIGCYVTARSAGIIDFFIPLQVESYEQGVALMAYYLRSTKLKNKPDWLDEGLALREHLPWEKETKAYNENPVAIIEHEWFRILVKKIRILIPSSSDDDVTKFSFDGSVLKVVCNNETFVITGLGKDWQKTVSVKTKSLDFLPKRIQNKDILIYVWKDYLYIGNRAFPLENESYIDNLTCHDLT